MTSRSEPLYVFVSGPLSGSPDEYLANVARMCTVSRQLMEMGYTTINPAADLLEGVVSEHVPPVDAYRERSLRLLELVARADFGCLYVISRRHRDGRTSVGVAAEIARALELDIPIVESIDDLEALRRAHGYV